MNDNIFYEVASKRLKGRSCYTALKKESLIDKLNVLNFEGATPLDVAIDYENWNTLKLFIQFNIKEDTIVKAIGELLSHYWHIGSSIIDKFIFQLIIKKGYLNRQECNFLLERAFDGNAWPFVVPLLNCSDLSQQRIEKYFHWQVSDNPFLRTELATLLTKVRSNDIFRKSIFVYCGNILRIDQTYLFSTNEKKLSSYIYNSRRKVVAKRMKKNVTKNHIDYRLIKRLMYMYITPYKTAKKEKKHVTK